MKKIEFFGEFNAAKAEGRCVAGIFRASNGVVMSASWEREFPGCFIAGQGGTVWQFEPASAEVARAAGV